jgi:hypothetical protein
MKVERKDVARLLDAASDQDQKQLAQYIDLDDDQNTTGDSLTKQLWWKYQTPVGYAIRTPYFDDICIAVAGKFMKIDKSLKDANCWEVLDKLSSYLINLALTEGNSKAIKAAIDTVRIPTRGGRTIKAKDPSIKNPFIISSQFAGALIRKSPKPIGMPNMVLGPIGWTMIAFQLNSLVGTNWQNIIPSVLYVSYIYNKLKADGKLPF